MSQLYRIPDDLDAAPSDSGGIYYFFLRFPSNYELGLSDVAGDIEDVKRNLVKVIERFTRFQARPQMRGHIFQPDLAKHLRRRYTLTATVKPEIWPAADVGRLVEPYEDYSSLAHLVTVLRRSLETSTLLYVGMAQKQSLRSRIGQHADGNTAFSERLAEAGLSWYDVFYRYEPIESIIKSDVPDVERLVQTFLKPILSVR